MCESEGAAFVVGLIVGAFVGGLGTGMLIAAFLLPPY